MAICPWCGTTIAKYFMDRHCPKCGKQLGDNRAASADATLATIEGSTLQEAIDNFEKDNKSEELSTVDWQPPELTIDSAFDSEAVTVDQEVLEHESSSNADDTARVLPAEQTVSANKEKPTNPNPSHDSRLTVDAGSNTSTAADLTIDVDSSSGTASDVTLDAPSLSTDSRSTGSGSQLSSFGTEQTLDSVAYGSSGSIYKSAEVHKIWEKAAGANIDPAHSLAKGPVAISDSVFDGISIRNLNVHASLVSIDADYSISNELGRGKQGVVYAARQKGLGRTVAIKLVMKGSTGRVERERLNRFVREAEITAALDHPNILPIHELAMTHSGELFYAMKKVDGRAWNEIIHDDQMTLSEHVECLLKVCDAIAFAHSKKVIHRDLKPGNIMIGGFGEVLVADWGMAVDLSKVENFRPTRELKDPFSFGGTPAYMSPEMAKHDWPKINTKSDIYLLGAILYHLVIGRPPRDGKTVYEVLERARANFFFPVENPSGLIAVALKAMETNPGDRYESVEDFQEAIREVNRHAESSRLSDHASVLLEEAKRTSDYSKFNESIFSFRNAIDLWQENKPAAEGLKKARFAYAENAFSRSDYDVCLETLDPKDAQEAVLFERASLAQAESRSRESRYRRLRRVTSIGALIAVAILSGLSFWLWTSIEQVRLAKNRAEKSELLAINEAKNAKVQEGIARAEADKAREAERLETIAKGAAVSERDRANENAAALELTNRKLEAETIKKEAERARAEQKSIEALFNERIAKLGGYQSSLLSAFNLAESFNVRRSSALLKDVRELQDTMALASPEQNVNSMVTAQGAALRKTPFLTTWPYRRVASIVGLDLPKLDLEGKVSCFDIASGKPVAVIGTAEGANSKLQLIRLTDNKLERDEELEITVDRSVTSVAISPDGSEVVFICESASTAQPSIFHWNLISKKVEPIAPLKNRQLQWVAFSPDGKNLVAGLNGGIYRWPREQQLNFEADSAVIYQCKGILGDIQFVPTKGSKWKAVCNVIQEVPSKGIRKLAVYELDLESDRFEVLLIPDLLANQATTIAEVGLQGELCLGTVDGRLWLLKRANANADGEVGLEVIEELFPRMHQTRMRHIRPWGATAFLTIGQDNAPQLWENSQPQHQINENSKIPVESAATELGSDSVTSWRHAQPLVGLPDSVIDGRFHSAGKRVLAVDENGTCVDWDIAAQAARQRMDAPESASGMVAIGGVGETGENWWIDREGMLQRWNGIAGSKLSTLHYPGHTPNAEFVDQALSVAADRLVTVARLTERSNSYRLNGSTALEFCVWELSSGKMLHRWEVGSETAARIALVNNGQKIIWVNESQTTVCDLDGTNLRVLKNGEQEIAAVEIAQHPVDANLVALIGDKGEVWMTDLSNEGKVIQYNRDWAFEVANVHVLRAVWNSEGNRLYMLRNASEKNDMALVAVDWLDGKLSQNELRNDRLEGLQFPSHPNFKHVADLRATATENGDETVCLVARYKFSDLSGDIFEAWSAKIEFVANKKSQVVSQKHKSKVWLDKDAKLLSPAEVSQVCRVSQQSFAKVMMDRVDAVATVAELGEEWFLPTVVLETDSVGNRSYGRTSCISADGDAACRVWITSHQEGELWEAKLADSGEVVWNRIPRSLLGDVGLEKIDVVSMSPTGTHAVLTDTDEDGGSVLIDLSNKSMVKKWNRLTRVAWHPSGEQIALADIDGQVKLFYMRDQRESEFRLALAGAAESDLSLQRINWFRENLIEASGKRESVWYLVAQTGANRLQLSSVDENVEKMNFQPIVLDSKITSVACSPLDNTMVIGVANGNISTWFVSPSVDSQPRELFSIDAHRGAIVSDLQFSSDGDVLFSADAPEFETLSYNRGKGYGWSAIKLQDNQVEPAIRAR